MGKVKDFFTRNGNSIIIPTLTLFVICLVVSLALSGANMATSPKIKALTEKQQKDAMSKLLPADDYNADTIEIDGKKVEYTVAKSNGKAAGYIFVVSESGYGGDVSVMTAVNTDGTVKAVDILDVTSETPGLGQNTSKENFYGQYAGKTNGIIVQKNGANSENNEIDACTGATISSRAVTSAVNTALGYAEKIMANENAGGGENAE